MTRDYSLDEIGKRLSGEGLTPQEQILAADDWRRVEWVRGAVAGAGNTDIIDIGASDGTLAEWWARLGHRVFTIESHDAHRERLSTLPVFSFHGDAWTGVTRFTRLRKATVFLGEILEHLDSSYSQQLVQAVAQIIEPDTIVITVPNANCESYLASGRARRDWPDHQQQFQKHGLWTLFEGLDYSIRVYPIVGTLDDSIWLGAVARRT